MTAEGLVRLLDDVVGHAALLCPADQAGDEGFFQAFRRWPDYTPRKE
jgi:hypothetical protein